MKAVLVHPRRTSSEKVGIEGISEPLGLLFLASHAKRCGHQIKIFDQSLGPIVKSGISFRKGFPDDSLIDCIKSFKPNILGISCNFSMYFNDVVEICRLVKQKFPSLPIVLGGGHCTLNYGKVLEQAQCDIVVRGEGELTFTEILNGIALENVRGASYRKNGQIYHNPDREFIEDLDSLEIPDYSLIDYRKYFEQNVYLHMAYPAATLFTSRGCPYDCIFCTSKKLWKQKYRRNSAAYIVSWIKKLVADYGIKEITFHNEQFLADKNHVDEFCERLLQDNIRIKWWVPTGLSVWLLEDKLIEKMQKSGLYRVSLTIESGSPASIRFMRKSIDLEKAKRAVKMLKRLGIYTCGIFIIGFPEETIEDIILTRDFSVSCGVDYATFYICQPFEGTDLFDYYRKHNLLKGEPRLTSTLLCTQYDTRHFKAEELNELAGELHKFFVRHKIKTYLNPLYFHREVYPKISSIPKLAYAFRSVSRALR